MVQVVEPYYSTHHTIASLPFGPTSKYILIDWTLLSYFKIKTAYSLLICNIYFKQKLFQIFFNILDAKDIDNMMSLLYTLISPLQNYFIILCLR